MNDVSDAQIALEALQAALLRRREVANKLRRESLNAIADIMDLFDPLAPQEQRDLLVRGAVMGLSAVADEIVAILELPHGNFIDSSLYDALVTVKMARMGD